MISAHLDMNQLGIPSLKSMLAKYYTYFISTTKFYTNLPKFDYFEIEYENVFKFKIMEVKAQNFLVQSMSLCYQKNIFKY